MVISNMVMVMVSAEANHSNRSCYANLQLSRTIKGELRSEISLLHMKILTLIKAKSNVFL